MYSVANDVVLSSRVRLARNFADLPFPQNMGFALGEEAQLRAADALARAREGKDFALLRLRDLPETARRLLEEKRLISRELLSSGESAALLLRRDERVSVMINEEDHLRIHVIQDGSALPEAARAAFEIDAAIGERVCYAFDAELGYLTSRPANMGTGLRASALVHLPSLMRTGIIGGLTREASRMGLLLQPLGGRDGAPQGDLFLLQNQVSLGRGEEELIDSIDAMAQELVDQERTAREELLMSADTRLEDRLFRSLGILRYARRLSEPEWLRRWSDVRLGVQAGFFKVALGTLDRLLTRVRPAHLEEEAGKELSPIERDERRALLVRKALEK